MEYQVDTESGYCSNNHMIVHFDRTNLNGIVGEKLNRNNAIIIRYILYTNNIKQYDGNV